MDREGVSGLARRLSYTERHIHRVLVDAVGASPIALARAQRAQTARILLETTSVPITEVAFAAGFGSVRQFNGTVQEVFACAPTQLRERARRNGRPQESGAIELRLPFRAPFDGSGLLEFLGHRAVPGVEERCDGAFRRSMSLPHGFGVVELRVPSRADSFSGGTHLIARFWLDSLQDLAAAMQRSRCLLDLDADPAAVVEALGEDELLGPLVTASPGRRVPGSVRGEELAVRAVLGQQISVSGARTLAGKLVSAFGAPLSRPIGSVTHAFPSTEALAKADPACLPMPASRGKALQALCGALASEELTLDAGCDWASTRAQLLSLPGIGPWTADYIAMRGLRDPDAFLPGDLGVRRALERLRKDGRPAAAERISERWRPYRAYAVQHLWSTL